MELDKCFIEKEQNYWGYKVNFVYFRCPNGHNHDICLPITTGEHFIAHRSKSMVKDENGNMVEKINEYPVWHYEVRDGKMYISPSVDCSESKECKFHETFSFREIVDHPEDIWK